MVAARLAIALGALSLGTLALPSAAHGSRVRPHTDVSLPHPHARAIQVVPADSLQLLQCLLGPGVQVGNVVLTAAPGSTGLFSGGAAILGIDQGIVLSTGNISSLVGPNLLDDTSTDNAFPGDPDLDALIPGYVTYDATILEFDFTCDQPTAVSFQYVFASEEYNEWVGSPYNDVFAFFLNGTNIAAVPAICSSPGIPVAINNVDCSNPYSPPSGPNCDCFRNNDLSDGGGSIDTEMDGITQVFYASAALPPGTSHMKLAIADAGDHVLDSNVMIHCQSFTCSAAPNVGACCMGGTCFLQDRGECEAQGGVYMGDDSPCVGVPCEAVPVRESMSVETWGRVKGYYR